MAYALMAMHVGALGDAALNAQTRGNILTAAGDPRAEPELTICSQNLANYGLLADAQRRDSSITAEALRNKEIALAKRFIAARCDVIAAQELLGKDEATAKKALLKLASTLRLNTNRLFDVLVGPSNDKNMRNGYLYAKDRADFGNSLSYYKVELPKLTEEQKPRRFTRGPLELQLIVKGRKGSPPKTVTLINFHFKSRSGAAGDPAALQWETYRMEMAEGLRRILESRHRGAFATGENILVVLGDRNSHFDTASAKILDGTLSLAAFQENGACRLSKRGVPLCQAGAALPQRLFSVLTTDPQVKELPGTFAMGDTYSWIDDILMPQESLSFAWASAAQEGDYDVGLIYGPKEASDHALVYVRLNW